MDDRASAWFRQRSSHWQDWPLDRLLESKRRQGVRISVVIPARDEAGTVAGVVTAIRQALVLDAPLVDEVVVVDSDSADATAAVAARAGATVHRARDIAPSSARTRARARRCGSRSWSPGATCWSSWTPTHSLGTALRHRPGRAAAGRSGVRLVKGFYARVKPRT